MGRIRLVAGNWKMHGSRQANRTLLEALIAGVAQVKGVECTVCVPFPYLGEVAQRLAGTPIAWGAQNVSEHAQGAYTGEVSAAMLAEFGCRHVIVGHSERRQLFGESDAQAAAKLSAQRHIDKLVAPIALVYGSLETPDFQRQSRDFFTAVKAAGMTPILCVGETLEDRDAGRTEEVVGRQLGKVLEKNSFEKAVLAYEPVWAIGTGRNATPEQAQEVHVFLRRKVSPETAIIYGGSVKPQNAAALFAMPDIDGGLIGGASLVAKDFIDIVRAAKT